MEGCRPGPDDAATRRRAQADQHDDEDDAIAGVWRWLSSEGSSNSAGASIVSLISSVFAEKSTH